MYYIKLMHICIESYAYNTRHMILYKEYFAKNTVLKNIKAQIAIIASTQSCDFFLLLLPQECAIVGVRRLWRSIGTFSKKCMFFNLSCMFSMKHYCHSVCPNKVSHALQTFTNSATKT